MNWPEPEAAVVTWLCRCGGVNFTGFNTLCAHCRTPRLVGEDADSKVRQTASKSGVEYANGIAAAALGHPTTECRATFRSNPIEWVNPLVPGGAEAGSMEDLEQRLEAEKRECAKLREIIAKLEKQVDADKLRQNRERARDYKELVQERDMWREMALENSETKKEYLTDSQVRLTGHDGSVMAVMNQGGGAASIEEFIESERTTLASMVKRKLVWQQTVRRGHTDTLFYAPSPAGWIAMLRSRNAGRSWWR